MKHSKIRLAAMASLLLASLQAAQGEDNTNPLAFFFHGVKTAKTVYLTTSDMRTYGEVTVKSHIKPWVEIEYWNTYHPTVPPSDFGGHREKRTTWINADQIVSIQFSDPQKGEESGEKEEKTEPTPKDQ